MSALKQLLDDLKQIEDTIDSIEIPARGRCRVYMAKYDYDPFKQSPNDNPDAELAFQAGDYILVFDTLDEDGFFIGELIDGRRGFVPSNWLEQLTGEDLFEFQATTLYKQSSNLEIEVKPMGASNHAADHAVASSSCNSRSQKSTPLKSCMSATNRSSSATTTNRQPENRRTSNNKQPNNNNNNRISNNNNRSDIRYFVALFDYDPSTMSPNPNAVTEELTFKAGSIIKIYGDRGADEFYRGELDNRMGFVPSNVVEEIKDVNKLYSLQQQYKFPAIAPNLLFAALPGFAEATNQLTQPTNLHQADQQQQQQQHHLLAAAANVVPLNQQLMGNAISVVAPSVAVPVSLAAAPPALVPRQAPQQQQQQQQQSYHQAMPACLAGNSKRMRALYDYDPRKNSPNIDTESEVPFKLGDVIHVYGKMDTDGFYMGEVERTKQRGLVPSNFLTEDPLPNQQQQQLVTIVPVQQQQQQQPQAQQTPIMNNLQQQPQQQLISIVPVQQQQQPLNLSNNIMMDDMHHHNLQQQPMPLNNQPANLMNHDLQQQHQQRMNQQQQQQQSMIMNQQRPVLQQLTQQMPFGSNMQQQPQQQQQGSMFNSGLNQQMLQNNIQQQPQVQNINRPTSLSLSNQQQPMPMQQQQQPQQQMGNFNQQQAMKPPMQQPLNQLHQLQQQQPQPLGNQSMHQPQQLQQPQQQQQQQPLMINGHPQQQQLLQQQQLAAQQQLRAKSNLPVNSFNANQQTTNQAMMMPNSNQQQQQLHQQQQQPLYYGAGVGAGGGINTSGYHQQHAGGMGFDAHGNSLNQTGMNGDEQGGNILNIFKNMLKL